MRDDSSSRDVTLERLGTLARAELTGERSAEQKAAGERALLSRWSAERAASKRRARRWVLAAAATVALASGGIAAYRHRAARAVVTFTSSDDATAKSTGYVRVPASSPARALTFSDGSQVELSPASAARVDGRSAHGADVVVEEGRAAFTVAHHADTRWSVRAGPFDVAVIGTEFDVQWSRSEQTFVVRLREGAVTVRGPEGTHVSLHAGEQASARVGQDGIRVLPIDQAVTPPQAREPSPSADARVAPEETPPMRAPASSTKPAESSRLLFEQGEAMRMAGDHAGAEASFDRLVQRYPSDPRAALAAYQLGRIRLGSLHDPKRAIRAFEFVLAHEPHGPFAEDAAAGRIEAAAQLGDLDSCRRWRDAFLAAHPASASARRVSRLCGP